MSTTSDPRRSIAAWLEAEAPDRAPERLIDASREQIKTTRQRRAIWPAWKDSPMNAFAKLAMAAAAVLVVAIVGYTLLPGRGGVGGPAPQPSPSPSVAPTPTATPVPTPVQVVPSGQLTNGPLEPGTYTQYALTATDVDVRFTVPTGWRWEGYLTTSTADAPDGVGIAFWTGDIQVYSDPCQWEGSEPATPTGPTARDLVDALAAQPQRGSSAPVERRGAGPEGPDAWPGWSVDQTVPADADLVGGPCDRGEFRSWGPEQNARYHQGPEQRDTVWAVDVDGDTRIIVVIASFPATPPETMAEVDAILESMVFGRLD